MLSARTAQGPVGDRWDSVSPWHSGVDVNRPDGERGCWAEGDSCHAVLLAWSCGLWERRGEAGGGHCFEAYWNGKGNEEEIWAPGIRCSGERWENARLVVRGKSPRAFLTQILTCVIRLGRMQTSPLCLLEQDATEGRFIFYIICFKQGSSWPSGPKKKKLKMQVIYLMYGPLAEPEACLVRCAQTAASSPCRHGWLWGLGTCFWVLMGTRGHVAMPRPAKKGARCRWVMLGSPWEPSTVCEHRMAACAS